MTLKTKSARQMSSTRGSRRASHDPRPRYRGAMFIAASDACAQRPIDSLIGSHAATRIGVRIMPAIRFAAMTGR